MKKGIFVISIFFSLNINTNSQIIPEVILSTNSKTVESIYKPANITDPILPSTIYNSQTVNKKLPDKTKEQNINTSTTTLTNFVLVGIIQFSDKKEALLKDNTGAIYLVRNGKIYDNKKNEVKGFKANIKGKQVIIINEKNKEKPIELFIKE